MTRMHGFVEKWYSCVHTGKNNQYHKREKNQPVECYKRRSTAVAGLLCGQVTRPWEGRGWDYPELMLIPLADIDNVVDERYTGCTDDSGADSISGFGILLCVSALRRAIDSAVTEAVEAPQSMDHWRSCVKTALRADSKKMITIGRTNRSGLPLPKSEYRGSSDARRTLPIASSCE